MASRPILFHIFHRPLPYGPTLALQQKVHEFQLQRRRVSPDSHDDVLLLLEHRPVYTAGRRQTEDEVLVESTRLKNIGAEFVATQRGGQTTYHGPGQVVAYPLLDLRRMHLSIAQYICKLQTAMKYHFINTYGIQSVDSDNTGVFLSEDVKLGSIGVQIRHRLTSHGLAYNVTREPLQWFNQVVACGLTGVRAGCIAGATGRDISVPDDLNRFLPIMSRTFGREMININMEQDGQLQELIRDLEADADRGGPWPAAPISPISS
ncbi:lipoyltransferase [Hysterangium stoloniferum]|nr:lipoyltransferase [Hysterangium stoloniferum]